MVWLRRAIGVIFALAVAIGAGLVFLSVAAANVRGFFGAPLNSPLDG
ncbi:MAG TPA: hypothetical protein VGP28_13615 [Methylocella sp.]|jgi:hypothetical protein|nr:hypothetical protein [Methylocella sp.]